MIKMVAPTYIENWSYNKKKGIKNSPKKKIKL